MNICVAQTRPVRGDITANISRHIVMIGQAAACGAEVIIFPELSLTGYEPRLAAELATVSDDARLDVFQAISNATGIVAGVGLPIRSAAGIGIGMVVFQPHVARQTYSKRHLHSDEYPYFVPGTHPLLVMVGNSTIAPAICYELTVPEHAADASTRGADLYAASVAKTRDGVKQAERRLAEIAKTYGMAVMMANSVGPSDDFESAGGSAIWRRDGTVAARLDDSTEGLLVFDTDSETMIVQGNHI